MTKEKLMFTVLHKTVNTSTVVGCKTDFEFTFIDNSGYTISMYYSAYPTYNCQMLSIFPLERLLNANITKEDLPLLFKKINTYADRNAKLLLFDIKKSREPLLDKLFDVNIRVDYISTNKSKMILGNALIPY